jgi:hypothetical protein
MRKRRVSQETGTFLANLVTLLHNTDFAPYSLFVCLLASLLVGWLVGCLFVGFFVCLFVC